MRPDNTSPSQFVHNMTITANAWSRFEEGIESGTENNLPPSTVARYTEETLRLYSEENQEFLKIVEESDQLTAEYVEARDRIVNSCKSVMQALQSASEGERVERPEVGSPDARSADLLFRPSPVVGPAMPHSSRYENHPTAQQFHVRTLLAQPVGDPLRTPRIQEKHAVQMTRGEFRNFIHCHPRQAQELMEKWSEKRGSRKFSLAFNRLVAANNDIRRGNFSHF